MESSFVDCLPAGKQSRDYVMELIKQQQGEVVASAAKKGEICIVGDSEHSLQIKSVIKKGICDVVHYRYILECIKANCLLPLYGLQFYVKPSTGMLLLSYSFSFF